MTKIKYGCNVGANEADAPMGAPNETHPSAPTLHPCAEGADLHKRLGCTHVHPSRTHELDQRQGGAPSTPVPRTGAWVHPAALAEDEDRETDAPEADAVDHLHPDHTCAQCRAEENALRMGYEDENPRELWPDYWPPAATTGHERTEERS